MRADLDTFPMVFPYRAMDKDGMRGMAPLTAGVYGQSPSGYGFLHLTVRAQ
jgi:hypothetical protein